MSESSLKTAALRVALAALCLTGAGVSAHVAAPRTPSVKVDNVVEISDKIVVTQKQTYEKEYLEAVWNVVDENKDGKFSAAEKKAFLEKGRPFYTDYTTVRLNWGALAPTSVTVNVDGWPSKKPKADAKLTMTLTAVYQQPFAPQPLHLVDVVIPNINAHEITCRFNLGAGKQVALASGQPAEMKQIDGHPDTFSVVFVQEQPRP